jgi:hypothetical protein
LQNIKPVIKTLLCLLPVLARIVSGLFFYREDGGDIFSETSVVFQRATWRHMPEDGVKFRRVWSPRNQVKKNFPVLSKEHVVAPEHCEAQLSCCIFSN